MRQLLYRRILLLLPALAWSGWYLVEASQRWAWMMSCRLRCPPMMPVEGFAKHLAATDWRTPLLLSTLPLAAYGAWCLWRDRRALAKPGHTDR